LRKKRRLILLGAIVVILCSSMTMIVGYPTIYSPYSFIVVLPAFGFYSLIGNGFFFRLLSVLPVAAVYVAWSLVMINESKIIPKESIVFALVLVAGSVFYNLASFEYGIKYQGEIHTYIMYLYNIMCFIGMGLIARVNRISPSYMSVVGFHVMLFSWLGWVSFPWLGELI